MSFKIKKWALWRTVTLTDYIPGMKPYRTPGGAGINTSSYNYPWQSKIVIMCYDQDDTPVWCLYDPVSDTASGPYEGDGASWSTYSYFYGESCYYGYWGNQWLFGRPGGAMSYGAPNFRGWDRSFNFWSCPWADGRWEEGSPVQYPSSTLGTDGTNCTVMAYTRQQQTPKQSRWGVFTLGGGYAPLHTHSSGETPGFYFPINQGVVHYAWRQLGAYIGGYVEGVGSCVWSFIPHSDNYLNHTRGRWGGSVLTSDPMSFTFNPGLDGVPVVKYEPWITGNEYGPEQWPPATSPLSSGARSWQTRWDWWHQIDGGYPIDEYDLDGVDHDPGYQPVGRKPMSRASNGWYVATTSNAGINFTVYALDPEPPPGTSRKAARANGAVGWVGDYGIGTNLKLDHYTPFPEDRDPVGGGVQPPQERKDGFLVGRRELFQGTGVTYKYRRDVSLNLSSYPHGASWWFPGEAEDHTYPGFWHMFAGIGPTVIGYMPNPSYGMIDPNGQNCMELLGVPMENLKATGSTSTHVVKESYTLEDAQFATKITGTVHSQRRQLIGGFDGSTFAYTESGTRARVPPVWKAVVGTISGLKWKTIIDFGDIDSPGLGETWWTVWSVVPIPRCRPLPKGGWLAGATLYFDPWEMDSWEWTPGGREATFMDTGKGWVPAKYGYDGPLNNDDHAPIYLSGYDEWTYGRSLYGPDALLVYDAKGTFVTCLNSLEVHAPDGREIMVTGEANPRLIFRIYRHGTYSDFAEGYGMYHRLSGNEEIQAPLYAVYDLCDGKNFGPTNFQGFVEMYVVGNHAPRDNVWRWGVADTLYAWDYPKTLWSPPGPSYVRSGRGGGGITILSPGEGQGRSGVKGVGRRA